MKNYKTPSEQEIFDLIQDFKEIFSIEDILKLKTIKKGNLRKILHKLSKKGFILRLKKGTYIIRKFFLDKPYYFLSKAYLGNLAYLSALKVHDMIEYEPNGIYIQANKSKQIKIGSYNIRIIKSKYHFGIIKTDGMFATDREKTFLDCLMNPKFCDSVILIKAYSEHEFDFKRTLQYLKNIEKFSLYQKTGYVISKLYEHSNRNIPKSFIREAKSKIKNKIRLVSRSSRSKYDKDWKVMDNIGVQEVLNGY